MRHRRREAHYFLNHPDVRTLLDLDLAGYALVTYRSNPTAQVTEQITRAIRARYDEHTS